MTRAMAEITRLGEQLGGTRRTFGGLAGMGDLIVTCTSMHSRNNRAGILIGQGKTPQEAMAGSGRRGGGLLCRREHPSAGGAGGRGNAHLHAAPTRCSTRTRTSADVVTELMTRAKKDELLETAWL